MTDEDIIPVKEAQLPSGFKITRGYRLKIAISTPPQEHKKHGYWRHGIKKEVHQWLLDNVGETASHGKWEYEGLGEWIYLGSEQSVNPSGVRSRWDPCFKVNIVFATQAHAMMFKLRWFNNL